MAKKRLLRIIALFSIIGLLGVCMTSKPASALISQSSTSWFWTDNTTITSVATGDVNGDGRLEIVTGGYYFDGTRYVAQLAVWNSSNLALLAVTAWYWTSNTQISAVAIGDVNGDGLSEIITGGSYFDGSVYNAQLVVWTGSLGLVNVKAWNWGNDTQISSVALGNITASAGLSIVTGGSFFDGTRHCSQLAVWSGVNLAFQNVTYWYWTSNTYINSVAVANITGGTSLSVVTGGAYSDGTKLNAQLAIWNATNLAFVNVFAWNWGFDTEINAVAVANVTGGTALSIVTGGQYFDGARIGSQLVEWNGSTLAVQNVASWYWTSNTRITSLAVANYSGASSLDIITGGSFYDGAKNNAQIADFNGATFGVVTATSWFQTSGTVANSIAVGNTGFGNRIIAGGSFFDLTRENAQLTTWG